MKRILLSFISIQILLFFSCSKNETSDFLSIPQKQEIVFNSMRDRISTRAANDNKTTYKVYALIENTTNWYFETIVTPNTSTATNALDTSDKSYYWPGTTNVRFFAFAPSADSASTGITNITATTPPDIIIDYTIPPAADMDFTIATPVIQSGSSSTETSDPVTFTFKHMLSKIHITLAFSTELSDAGYSLNDDYTTELTVPYNNGSVNAGIDSSVWTIGSLNYSTYSNANDYLILPQTYSTTDTCVFQIKNVVIMRGKANFFTGELKPISLSVSDIANATFLPGNQYNFEVTITDMAHDDENEPIFNGQIGFISHLTSWLQVNVPIINQP